MPETIQNNKGNEAEKAKILQNKKLDSDQIAELSEIISTIIDVERERGTKRVWRGIAITLFTMMFFIFGLAMLA